MSKSQKSEFSVSGEFITKHARNLWQEYSFAKAFDLLECMEGSNRIQHEAIIMGRAKLVGINDVDLVPDDWTPPDDYPTITQAMERRSNWHELQDRREADAWQYANDNWLSSRGSKLSASGFSAYLKKLVGEDRAQEISDAMMHDYADTYKDRKYEPFAVSDLNKAVDGMKQQMIKAGMDPTALPSVNSIINRGFDINPVICSDMSSPSGWLLPDGKYYGCESMQHIGLAEGLMSGKITPSTDAEQIAEKLGWVKISSGAMGLYVVCQKRPTQQQLNRLLDYSKFHNVPYEKLTSTLDLDD